MSVLTRQLLALAADAVEPGKPVAGLTPAGATIMTLSIALVLAMTIFCFWRIMREPAPETHHHAPLEIETDDVEQ